MIRVFGKTDTDFTSNGDVVLRPLRAVVHKQDNGDYYLNLEMGLEWADCLRHFGACVIDYSTSPATIVYES